MYHLSKIFIGDYRFGFNGQEKDNEIYGDGNATTAEYWEYDPRLGRRWNTDPKPVPYESNYACFRNSPILMNDPDGDWPGPNGLGPEWAFYFTQWVKNNPVDAVHVALDVVGMVPIVGEIADGINGTIYLIQGNYLDASFSFAASVPIVGWGATGAKWTNKGVKLTLKNADGVTKEVIATGVKAITKNADWLYEAASATRIHLRNK